MEGENKLKLRMLIRETIEGFVAGDSPTPYNKKDIEFAIAHDALMKVSSTCDKYMEELKELVFTDSDTT